jgi:hypothetical protein
VDKSIKSPAHVCVRALLILYIGTERTVCCISYKGCKGKTEGYSHLFHFIIPKNKVGFLGIFFLKTPKSVLKKIDFIPLCYAFDQLIQDWDYSREIRMAYFIG